MAQFRGTIRGQRGEASRLGSKKSGMVVTCQGWRAGVWIDAYHNHETGKDYFRVYKTQGSGSGSKELIAEITEPNKDENAG